jgi:hypothetical protein
VSKPHASPVPEGRPRRKSGRSDLAAINFAIMNPRYRRMVIPGALAVLIVIVIVAALVS